MAHVPRIMKSGIIRCECGRRIGRIGPTDRHDNDFWDYVREAVKDHVLDMLGITETKKLGHASQMAAVREEGGTARFFGGGFKL